MAKDHTPPKTQANHKLPLKPRQIKPSAKLNQTPPKEENTRFYQLSLDKPQDKHRPLKQQSKSMHIWPRNKYYKCENNHQWSQTQTICHPQTRKAHWTCSTTRKMWTVTGTHLTTGVETIQLKVMSTWETNTMTKQTWVVTKASIWNLFLSFDPRPYEQIPHYN
jgi:hypothetical protein